MGKVDNLVVDSGGFLNLISIKDIAGKVYSTEGVIKEIKDKKTRQALSVLPYEINYREPSHESIKFVTDFSKKTGDFMSLSAVDIRVLALVYQLEKEVVGTDHIRTEPQNKVQLQNRGAPFDSSAKIPGFYWSKPNKKTDGKADELGKDLTSNQSSQAEIAECDAIAVDADDSDIASKVDVASLAEEVERLAVENFESKNVPCVPDDVAMEGAQSNEMVQVDSGSDEEEETMRGGANDGDELVASVADHDSGLDDEADDDSGVDDGDDEGWITPASLRHAKELQAADDKKIAVACLTTDFAMQNVLIQMGLNVVSIQGRLIKQARSYVLRCYACTKITKIMTKEFCPKCGNKTLKRVAMTIQEDGTVQYFINFKRPISTRGMQHSLPAPQGGKYAVNPILCADQKEAQQRAAQRAKESDYMTGDTPFGIINTASKGGFKSWKSGAGVVTNKRTKRKK